MKIPMDCLHCFNSCLIHSMYLQQKDQPLGLQMHMITRQFFLRSEKTHFYFLFYHIFLLAEMSNNAIWKYENTGKLSNPFDLFLLWIELKLLSAIFFGCVSRTLLASFALFFCGDLIQWSYNSFYTFGNFSFDWESNIIN